MSICKLLTRWVHRNTPESTGYDEKRWEAEQNPLAFASISKLIGHQRVNVTFTTIHDHPEVVRVRCNSNWKAENEPKGWYHRAHAVRLYRDLIDDGYTAF